MVLKEVKLVSINGDLYLVSEDKIKGGDLCVIPDVKKNVWDGESYKVDTLNSDYLHLFPEEYNKVRKIMAGPNEIGLVYCMGTSNKMDALCQIPLNDANDLLMRGGHCWIEYYAATNEARLIDGKVIIHLYKNRGQKEPITDRSCPCLYLKEPCQPNCTCVNPFMSNGCLNCAKYGSLKQRKRMAEFLNEARVFYLKNKPETLLDKMRNVLEHLTLATKIQELREEKNKIVREQDYEGAARLREEERNIQDKLDLLKPLDEETIKEIFYRNKK